MLRFDGGEQFLAAFDRHRFPAIDLSQPGHQLSSSTSDNCSMNFGSTTEAPPEPRAESVSLPLDQFTQGSPAGNSRRFCLAQFETADDGVGLVLVDQGVVYAEFALLKARQPIERRCDHGVEEQQLRGLISSLASRSAMVQL